MQHSTVPDNEMSDLGIEEIFVDNNSICPSNNIDLTIPKLQHSLFYSQINIKSKN
jgi:hypothetical protein